MFPTISEYNQAIQQNSRFAFNTLSNLTFIPSRSMPVKIFSFGSGSYAVVFKAVDGHKEYAIRCFISAENENIERYRKITSYLKAINESWVTDIELLENEINVIGKSFPIIKMEWIDGQLINNYVSQNLNNNTRLTELQEEIIKVSQSLERHQIGHGDIQCGNVIVAKGIAGKPLIKLIDYDGMYIPSFASQKNLERGRTEFQHPNRSHFEFNERMDRFSFWVILTALEALKYDKTLWNEVMQDGFNSLDNFLFIGDDFKYHYNSKVFKRLDQINSPSLKFYTDKIKFFCKNDCSNVIPLELFNEISINRNDKTEQQYSPDLSATHQNTIEIKPTPIFQSQEFDYNAASVNLKLRASIKDNTKGKIEKLESLKTLLDSGSINETEFQKLKNEILFQEETASLITPQVNQIKVNNPPLIKKKTKRSVVNTIIVVLILSAAAFVVYQLNTNNFSTKNQDTLLDEIPVTEDQQKKSAEPIPIQIDTAVAAAKVDTAAKVNEDETNASNKSSTIINNNEALQNTDNKIIGGVELNSLIKTGNILIRPLTKDISNYLDNDENGRKIQNKLQDIFSKEFSVFNLENRINDFGFNQAEQDVIIQYDYNVMKSNSGNEAMIFLSAYDGYTNSSIANCQFSSGRFFTNDNSKLINKLLNEIEVNPKINKYIHSFYEQMINNGREISFDIICDDSFGSDFKSLFKGVLLSDIIEDWISKNTIRGRWNLSLNNSKTYHYTAYMPISNSNGMSNSRKKWIINLQSYLRKNYQIKSTQIIINQGIPSLNLIGIL